MAVAPPHRPAPDHDTRASRGAPGRRALLGQAVGVTLCAVPGLATATTAATTATAEQAGDDGPPVPGFVPLGAGLWWLPAAADGEEGAARGRIAHSLLAQDGPRLWALGSGPSAAYGRALDAATRRRLGRPVDEVIAPWPMPELVLGQAGLPAARAWAHEAVARQMEARCAICIEALRERLGAAARDLGETALRLPERHLAGGHGRLGPWHWWRVARSADTTTTVWGHAASGWIWAPGLLGNAPLPEARETTLHARLAALEQLQRIGAAFARHSRKPLRWLPQDGPPDAAATPAAQRRYWLQLGATVDAALARGAPLTELLAEASAWPGLDAGAAASRRHQANVQRIWLEREDALLAGGPR